MKSLILTLTLLVSLSQYSFAIGYSTAPVDGIPKEWVEKKGKGVLRYANYIKSLDLKNITPHMVLEPHFKVEGRTQNSIPPRYLWVNIAVTLKVVDEISKMPRHQS